MKTTIYVNDVTYTVCKTADVESVIDELELEFNIDDVYWESDSVVKLTVSDIEDTE